MKFNLLVSVLFFYSFFSVGKAAADSQPFDSIARRIDLNIYSYDTQIRETLAELYAMAHNSPDSVRLISECIYREAAISYAQGLADSTLFTRIKHQLSCTDIEKYPYEYGLLLYSLAQSQDVAGQYAEAFPNCLQALEVFTALGDSLFIGRSQNMLGNVCSNVNIFNMAKDYYMEALSWMSPDLPDYYGIKINITMQMFMEENMNPIDSLQNLIPAIKQLENPGLLVLVYLNLGFLSWYTKEYNDIPAYCEEAFRILEDIDNTRLEALLNQNYALYYYFGEENYLKALEYSYQAKEIAQQYNRYDQLASIYDLMSVIYGDMQQYDSAYYYSRNYQEMNHQLVGNLKIIEAYQAYISTFLEASENKLTIAQQNIELNKKRFTVFITISVFIVLSALLFLIILQQKKRLKENENKELAHQLGLEKQIQQLQQEKQREVIESKTREIASYSLQLSNKNSILKQILDLTNQLSDNPKEVKNIHKKINTIIKNNYNIDNDWANFKMHFDKVHPNYFDKLKTLCSNLTENNLRYCAYFRIGLSTKQIAQIQNISPSSVIIHRSRLKKKFNLSEDANLDDFLREI